MSKSNNVTGVVRGSVAELAALQAVAAPGRIFQLNVSPFTTSVMDGAGGRTDIGAVPHLSGTLSNDVPSVQISDPMGTRPLAASLPDGATFCATDIQYAGRVYTHPVGGKLWYPTYINSGSSRFDNTSTAGIATLISKLGVYNPATRVFTRATVLGQFCNSRSSTTQAVPGGIVQTSFSPGILFATIAAAQVFALGQLVMTDANGEWTAYVVAAGNVPLGWCSTEGAITSLTAFTFDY